MLHHMKSQLQVYNTKLAGRRHSRTHKLNLKKMHRPLSLLYFIYTVHMNFKATSFLPTLSVVYLSHQP